MKLNWIIRELEYEHKQELDMNLMSQIEENPDALDDINLWLGKCLLDVELFKIYKGIDEEPENSYEEVLSMVTEQYEMIEDLLIESLGDAIIINGIIRNFDPSQDFQFKKDFEQFIDRLTKQLHSKKPLVLSEISYPKSNNESVNEYVNLIREEINRTEEDFNVKPNRDRKKQVVARNPRRISFESDRKNRIRQYLICIAREYSEESNKTFETLYRLKKVYCQTQIYSYDCVKMAVCQNGTSYINTYEEGISDSIHDIFNLRPIIKNQVEGGSIASIITSENTRKIIDWTNKVRSAQIGDPSLTQLKRKVKTHFLKRNRCIAIMEFPNNEHNNMFSISGNEFNDSGVYLTSFTKTIAPELKKVLKCLGNYDFCEQTLCVRYYSGTAIEPFDPNAGTYVWKTLGDESDWKTYLCRYSCCERKFLGKLENEMKEGIIAKCPQKIDLWTRMEICQRCEPAIADYENDYSATISTMYGIISI